MRTWTVVLVALVAAACHGLIVVPPGGDIQTALYAAAIGETVQLQGCEYNITESNVTGSYQEIAYLSFNTRPGTQLVGRSDCPATGQTLLRFQQDVAVSALPCGFVMRANDTAMRNIKVQFEFTAGSGGPPATLYDVCFVSAQLCDVNFCSITLGNGTFTDFFPLYVPGDIFNETLSGISVTNSMFNEYPPRQDCFFYLADPLALCDVQVNGNVFENNLTAEMLCRETDDQLCGPPDRLDFTQNCYSNESAPYLASPLVDPALTYLPLANCDCTSAAFPNGQVPSPLYTLDAPGGNVTAVYATVQQAYDANVTTLYIGAGYTSIDQTLVVTRPFEIIGTVPQACACDNGLIVSQDVNPAFLVIDSLLCLTNVHARFEPNSALAIYRSSDALEGDSLDALARFVPLGSLTAPQVAALTQSYVANVSSAPTPCPYLIDRGRFDNEDAALNALYAVAVLECGDDVTNNVIMRSHFLHFPLAIYSRVGELRLLKNIFRDSGNASTGAIVLDDGASRNELTFNAFANNPVGVRFTGASLSRVTCNVFADQSQADVLFPCGGFNNTVCFNCSAYAQALDQCLTNFFGATSNAWACPALIDDYAACNNEVDETQFYLNVSACLNASSNVPSGEVPALVDFLHSKFYDECIYHTTLGNSNPVLLHYIDASVFQINNIEFFLCMWITESSFCDQFQVGGGSNTTSGVCTRSIGNTVRDNRHQIVNGSHAGIVIPSGVQALSDNLLQLPVIEAPTDDVALVYQTVEGNAPINITLGINASQCHSASVVRQAPVALSPPPYTSAFYFETDASCRPPNTFPQVLHTGDSYSDDPPAANCSNCTIEFRMSPACFASMLPSGSNLTCETTHILAMSSASTWLQLTTTAVSCNATAGDYVWQTECHPLYDMYVLGAGDSDIYVLCDGYALGFPDQVAAGGTQLFVNDLAGAIAAAPPHSTIYLSDGTCCCDECIVDKPLTITSYHQLANETCYLADITCCPDLAGNQCRWVLGYVAGSDGSRLTHVHGRDVWHDERDTPEAHPGEYSQGEDVHRACVVRIGEDVPLPGPNFTTQWDDLQAPVDDLLFDHLYFTQSTAGICAAGFGDLTIANSFFGQAPPTCMHSPWFSKRDLAPPTCVDVGIHLYAEEPKPEQPCSVFANVTPSTGAAQVVVANNTHTDVSVGLLVQARQQRERQPARLCRNVDARWQLRASNNTYQCPRVAGTAIDGVLFSPGARAQVLNDVYDCVCDVDSRPLSSESGAQAYADANVPLGLVYSNAGNIDTTQSTFTQCPSMINVQNALWANNTHLDGSDLTISQLATNAVTQCPHAIRVAHVELAALRMNDSNIAHDGLAFANERPGIDAANRRGHERVRVSNSTLAGSSRIVGLRTPNRCAQSFLSLLASNDTVRAGSGASIYQELAYGVWNESTGELIAPAAGQYVYAPANQPDVCTLCPCNGGPCEPLNGLNVSRPPVSWLLQCGTGDEQADLTPCPDGFVRNALTHECTCTSTLRATCPSPTSSASASSSSSSSSSSASDDETSPTSYADPNEGEVAAATSHPRRHNSSHDNDDFWEGTILVLGILLAVALGVACIVFCAVRMVISRETQPLIIESMSSTGGRAAAAAATGGSAQHVAVNMPADSGKGFSGTLVKRAPPKSSPSGQLGTRY